MYIFEGLFIGLFDYFRLDLGKKWWNLDFGLRVKFEWCVLFIMDKDVKFRKK